MEQQSLDSGGAVVPIGKASGRGRKDSSGAPAKIITKPAKEAWKELMAAATKVESASGKYNDLALAVAEKCGVKTTVVKKLIKAAMKDRVEEVKAEIEQLDIFFNEIDPKALSA